jgi:hypothetical protein
MGRPLRPLTVTEQTRACSFCGAQPGQRCANPSGSFYSGGIHAAREHGDDPQDRSAWTGRYSAEGVHPRTLAEVTGGSRVIVRDAGGNFLPKVAVTPVIKGGSFLVVWVARDEEMDAAGAECRTPDAIPWPATDVWVPGEELGAGDGTTSR